MNNFLEIDFVMKINDKKFQLTTFQPLHGHFQVQVPGNYY